jgi:hypothetical protein
MSYNLMLNSVKKFRALPDKKTHSNSCVDRKKILNQTKTITPPPPPYKGYQINCLQRTPNQLSTKDTKSIVYKGYQINCLQRTPNQLSTNN